MRYFWMQVVWMCVGAALCWLVSRFDYRLLLRHGMLLHICAVVLNILVLFVGREIAGHRSWFAIGGFGVQPSEFVKLSCVIVLAQFFTLRPQLSGYGLRDLWRPLVFIGVPAAVILLQGDLGTTLYVLLLFAIYLLFARLRWRTLVFFVLLVTVSATAAYQTILTESQQARIHTFLEPEADPHGRGYHLIQSKVAVGSGGWTGRGYLQGKVNKLRFLPEMHTDFVFPVLAEEWGLVGCLFVLAIVTVLLLWGLDVARLARDRFGGLLAIGVVLWLFLQIMINLGGVLGLMPLTGVTFPFLSYGGSSMLITFVAMGLLWSVERRRNVF